MANVITPIGLTLAKLRERVYFFADETPNVNFPQSDVDTCINAGISVILDTLGPPEVKAITSSLVGVAEYDLVDADLDRRYTPTVTKVVLDGNKLSLGTTASTDSGTPTSYTIDGVSIVLSPIPDSNGVLEVTYVKQPTPLVNDTDFSPLSQAASEVACFYAVHLLKMKDDEWNAADRWRDLFEKRLQELLGPRTGVHKAV